MNRIIKNFAILLTLGWVGFQSPMAHAQVFKAGAAQSVITPPIGYSINVNFEDSKVRNVHDDTNAKAIVMDDGKNKLAIVGSDLCMMYKETLDKAKKRAHEMTGIPVGDMMMPA